MGVGDVIQGSSAGFTYIGIGDVGDEPPHGTGPGGFSTQGGQVDYREADPADSGRKLGEPPPPGTGNAGGRDGGGGGVCSEEE